MRVARPLIWIVGSGDSSIARVFGEQVFYKVIKDGVPPEEWVMSRNNKVIGVYSGETEALLAAQDNFERLVRECLMPDAFAVLEDFGRNSNADPA